jgi:hypothetical protein
MEWDLRPVPRRQNHRITITQEVLQENKLLKTAMLLIAIRKEQEDNLTMIKTWSTIGLRFSKEIKEVREHELDFSIFFNRSLRLLVRAWLRARGSIK